MADVVIPHDVVGRVGVRLEPEDCVAIPHHEGVRIDSSFGTRSKRGL